MGASVDRLIEESPAQSGQSEGVKPVSPDFDSIAKLAASLQSVHGMLTSVGYDTLRHAGLTTENTSDLKKSAAYQGTPPEDRPTALEQPLVAIGYGAHFGEPTDTEACQSYSWILSDATKALQQGGLLKRDSPSSGTNGGQQIHRAGLIDNGDGSRNTFINVGLTKPAQPVFKVVDHVRAAIRSAHSVHLEWEAREARRQQEALAAKQAAEEAKSARTKTVMTLSDLGGSFEHTTLDNMIRKWREFYTVLFKQNIPENPVIYKGDTTRVREWINDGKQPTPVLKIAAPVDGPSLYETLLNNARRFGVTISADPSQASRQFNTLCELPFALPPHIQLYDSARRCFSPEVVKHMLPIQPMRIQEPREDTLSFLVRDDCEEVNSSTSQLSDLAKAEDVVLAFFMNIWGRNQPAYSKLFTSCERTTSCTSPCSTRTGTTNGAMITVQCLSASSMISLTTDAADKKHPSFKSR